MEKLTTWEVYHWGASHPTPAPVRPKQSRVHPEASVCRREIESVKLAPALGVKGHWKA